jgi:predicted ATPase
MLSKLRVHHYKSLFDTEVDLEPLTVLIGPNGSGKSNICESLAVLSDFLQRLLYSDHPRDDDLLVDDFTRTLKNIHANSRNIKSKYWHGKSDYLSFEVKSPSSLKNNPSNPFKTMLELSIYPGFDPSYKFSIKIDENQDSGKQDFNKNLSEFLFSHKYLDSPLAHSLKRVSVYDFAPNALSVNINNSNGMNRIGEGIAYALVDILHTDRKSFDELEDRLTQLVPNIKKISLPRGENQTFQLELIDRYSEHHIPASDVSDGTLRILAFLTALYQEDTPSIICFEELENGVHPWLLHKMMELLKIVSTEGINGKPVQILITTHSPLLLDYVEPYQVRAVELDHEGKTQVHALPTDSVRFQKALEAYDGALSELWFTNVFGGNPV